MDRLGHSAELAITAHIQRKLDRPKFDTGMGRRESERWGKWLKSWLLKKSANTRKLQQ